MKKLLLSLFVMAMCAVQLRAQETTPAEEPQMSEEEMTLILQQYSDSIEGTFKYQTGQISLNGIANLNVPAGWKYLDGPQAERVLTEIWGNPPSPSLGMLIQENTGVLSPNAFAYNIEWEEIGYVEDDDAQDTDYAELLKQMQVDAIEERKARVAQGFTGYDVMDWASTPYYDSNKKVLHWAKELRFDGEDENTINYNIRVLGRKGVMVLNAIGTKSQLEQIKSSVDPVLSSVAFTEGNRYEDFDDNVDEVAAYTIGGLVAGKVLAKVGFFAVLAKFGKFIFIGLAAAGAGIWRFIKGRRKDEDQFPQIEQNNS